jgi:hypothetical protein
MLKSVRDCMDLNIPDNARYHRSFFNERKMHLGIYNVKTFQMALQLFETVKKFMLIFVVHNIRATDMSLMRHSLNGIHRSVYSISWRS